MTSDQSVDKEINTISDKVSEDEGQRPRLFDEREELEEIRAIRNVERNVLGRRRRIPTQAAADFAASHNCTGENIPEETISAFRQFLKEHDVKALENARNRAKELGYAPFTHLGIRAFHWIRHNCADWVMDSMERGLEDPEKIFPAWGCRFAITMSEVGREECERAIEADCLYDMVTASPHWTKERRMPGQGGSQGSQNGRRFPPSGRGDQSSARGHRGHRGRRGNEGRSGGGPRRPRPTSLPSSRHACPTGEGGNSPATSGSSDSSSDLRSEE